MITGLQIIIDASSRSHSIRNISRDIVFYQLSLLVIPDNTTCHIDMQQERDFEEEQLAMDQEREDLEREEREARMEVDRITTATRQRRENRATERGYEEGMRNALEMDIQDLTRKLRQREERCRFRVH